MDLDDFRGSPEHARYKVERALADMDDDLRGIVLTALEGPVHEFPHNTIAKVLTRNGWPMNPKAVERWRERNCG